MPLRVGLAHEDPPLRAESAPRPAWFRSAALFAPLPLLAACGGPLSALEPEGPSASSTATLWWAMFFGAALIFVVVLALGALAMLRPRAIASLGPKRTILWGGLIVPSLILTMLVIAAFALGERLLAAPRPDMPLRIEVTARQWVWDFRYPDGSVTSGHVRMPAGEDVDFVLESADVIHGFWIPRLGGKLDAIPGHRNVIRLRADRPGTYGGVCAEYCGSGHAVMPFTVEALPRAEFDALSSGLAEARR
nr:MULTISPECIES: cytochrome c oxidase subunit II [unclassified Aminobacter]